MSKAQARSSPLGRAVGLTGGIASGKTLVATTLGGFGIPVVDADRVGRDLLEENGALKDRIVQGFGRGILKGGKHINREALGRIVFNDAVKRKELEAILHGPIIREMWRRVEGFHGPVVLDVPLLIETGLHREVSVVIVVYATRDQQVERLKRRNGLSSAEARRRIDSQMPLEKKVAYGHYLINNCGAESDTKDQVRRLYHTLWRERETS